MKEKFYPHKLSKHTWSFHSKSSNTYDNSTFLLELDSDIFYRICVIFSLQGCLHRYYVTLFLNYKQFIRHDWNLRKSPLHYWDKTCLNSFIIFYHNWFKCFQMSEKWNMIISKFKNSTPCNSLSCTLRESPNIVRT